MFLKKKWFFIFILFANNFCFASKIDTSFSIIGYDCQGVNVQLDSQNNQILCAAVANDNLLGRNQCALFKINLNGTILQQKVVLNSLDEVITNAILIGNRYYVIGYVTDTTNNIDALLYAFDKNFNLIFRKTYGQINSTEGFTNIASILPNELFLSGYKTNTMGVGNEVWVNKMDSNGNHIFQNSFSYSTNAISIAVLPQSNGTFVLVGDKQKFDNTYNAFSILCNAVGQKIWEAPVFSPFNGGSKNAKQISDGNVLILGETMADSLTAYDELFSVLNLQDEFAPFKTIHLSEGADGAFDGVEFKPAHWLTTGFSFNPTNNSTDGFIAQNSENGTIQSIKKYGGNQYDILKSLVYDKANQHIVAVGLKSTSVKDEFFLVIDTVEDLSTPVFDIFNLHNISIYPNPTNGLVHIIVNNYHGLVFGQLFDLTGAEKKNFMFQGNCTKDFSDLPAGVYFMKFRFGLRTLTQKIVFTR